MRTLLAGDTHAAPPRGQMYVYQHEVRVCYLTYVACAIPLASARLLWGIGSGLPSRVSASPSASTTPQVSSEPALESG